MENVEDIKNLLPSSDCVPKRDYSQKKKKKSPGIQGNMIQAQPFSCAYFLLPFNNIGYVKNIRGFLLQALL